MKGLLARVLRRLLVSLAVVAAVLVAVSWLLVQQVPGWQSELEAWASRVLGAPLKVSRVEAGWGLRGPELHLYDVEVGQPNADVFPVAARAATVSLDLLRVLREGRLGVHRLRMSGVDLSLSRDLQGTWHVQGRPLQPGDNAPRMPALSSLHLVLEQGRLVYQPAPDEPTYEFESLEIVLERRGESLRMRASSRLPAELGESLELTADAALPRANRALTLEDVAWSVYAQGQGLELAAWASLLDEWDPGLPAGGRGDLRVWVDLQGAAPQRVIADVDFHDLVLPRQLTWAEGGDERYERLAGLFEWHRDALGWQAEATGVLVERGGRRWRGEQWRIDTAESGSGGLQIELAVDRLELRDLLPFVGWSTDGELRERLRRMSPGGGVSDFILTLELGAEGGVEHFRAEGMLERGRWQADGELPAVAGLGGRFRVDRDGGRFELATSALLLAHEQTFREPLDLGRAQGLFVWRRGGEGWRVVGDDLQVVSRDVQARGHLELTVPHEGSPRLELEADASRIDLTTGLRVLPDRRIPEAAMRWLGRAFPAGELRDARVSLSGVLAEFPFDQGDGRFLVEGRLQDVTLDYSDHWPPITGAEGRVRFSGAGVRGEVTGGRIAQSPVLHGEMEIADLRRPVLHVAAAAASDGPRLLQFLQSSPAGDGLGPGLSRVRGEGPAQVALDLILPLAAADEAQWQGIVELQGLDLEYGEVPLSIAGLRGELHLENGRAFADSLQGWIEGERFTARLDAPREPEAPMRVEAEGGVSAAVLLERLALPQNVLLAGIAGWQLKADVPRRAAAAAGEPIEIRVTSDLVGLHSDLPAPLAKLAREPRPLELELRVQDERLQRVQGRLGPNLGWLLEFGGGGDEAAQTRGNVHFGAAPPLLPLQRGLTVTGRMALLEIDPWLALGERTDGSDALLQSVSLSARLARGLGQEVSNLDLQLTRGDDGWLLQLYSEALAGLVRVPGDLHDGRALELDMQRLLLGGGQWLAPPGGVEGTEPLPPPAPSAAMQVDPRRLPSLRIVADEFGIGAMRFGRLDLAVERDDDGLSIVRLLTLDDHFQIEGSGRWSHDEQSDTGSRTEIGLQLQSRDVAETLRSLDYDARVDSDQGTVRLDLNWDGAPYSSRWRETLAGELSVELGSGRLGDVDPGAGRVFGLMSLSALPRRLALDFRDVFARGLTFDSIQGDFLLLGGDAYTDNLRLRGPAGEIGLVGRTGLATRDYQQQALVTADVGMALPAVGGLLGGPGVGAAILVFQEIFSAPLRGIGRATYCITGTWEAPDVRRLSAAELEQERLCAGLPGQDGEDPESDPRGPDRGG